MRLRVSITALLALAAVTCAVLEQDSIVPEDAHTLILAQTHATPPHHSVHSPFGNAEGSADVSKFGDERDHRYKKSNVFAGELGGRDVVGPNGDLQDPDKIGKATDAQRVSF